MLIHRVYRECLLVNSTFASPISFAFWPSANSLISLVLDHDDLNASLLVLFMGSCSEGTSLGCQSELLFFPLYRLMASRYRREDAVTVALTGRGSLRYFRISLESPSRSSSYHGSVPVFRFFYQPLILEYLYSFRANESHVLVTGVTVSQKLFGLDWL